MTSTLVAMSPAILVLLAIGTLTLLLGWWLAVVAEGRDEWLTGDDE